MKEREYIIIAHQEEDGGYWTEVRALPGAQGYEQRIAEWLERLRGESDKS